MESWRDRKRRRVALVDGSRSGFLRISEEGLRALLFGVDDNYYEEIKKLQVVTAEDLRRGTGTGKIGADRYQPVKGLKKKT